MRRALRAPPCHDALREPRRGRRPGCGPPAGSSSLRRSRPPRWSSAWPRSVRAVRTTFPGATCHMSVVIVSPGNTTPEKRTSNALSFARVVAAVRLQHRAAGVSVGAEAVEDRAVEAAHRGELRVGVQRVHVARESVDERLLRQRLHADRLVGRAVRAARCARRSGPRSPPKPPSPRTKMLDGVAEDELALGVDRVGLDHDDGALALVVDRLDRRRGRERAARRDRRVDARSACSPCSTMAGFTCIAPPRFSMAGNDGTTANVGSTFSSRS